MSLAMMVGILTPVIVMVVGVMKDRRLQERIAKSPQKEKLLRPPGYSLSQCLIELGDDLYLLLVVASGVSALAAIAITATVKVWAAGVGISWIVLIAAVALGFVVLSINRIQRIFASIEEMRRCRLGLRGEQAVAESLSESAASGFRAFHDLPGHEISAGDAKWNIDHVLVGPRGVLVIETKARMRRPGKGPAAAHEVTVDGEKLVYASGRDLRAIPQAKNNARTLASFLTKETGEKVSVDWLVVVPGYFVKADKANYAHVMNATSLAKFLPTLPQRIEPAQVRRITNAIDKKCRDVEF